MTINPTCIHAAGDDYTDPGRLRGETGGVRGRFIHPPMLIANKMNAAGKRTTIEYPIAMCSRSAALVATIWRSLFPGCSYRACRNGCRHYSKAGYSHTGSKSVRCRTRLRASKDVRMKLEGGLPKIEPVSGCADSAWEISALDFSDKSNGLVVSVLTQLRGTGNRQVANLDPAY
jgi:hypothetical protein